MHPETRASFLEHIATLEQRHRALRASISDPAQLARFDRLAKLTAYRARLTLRIYLHEPFDEPHAIASMYSACDPGLQLLDLLHSMTWPEAQQQLAVFAARDLWRLLEDLFTWVVAPGGEPEHELVS